MPLRAIITEACAVIDGFAAETLSVDQGFDSDAVIEESTQRDMKVVIPPKKVCKKEMRLRQMFV